MRALAATIAVGVLVLSGCTPMTGGTQTAAAVEKRIESLDGVASASVQQESSTSGFAAKRSSVVLVTVDEGYSVGDPVAAFSWLAQTAWSLDDDGPTTQSLLFEFVDATGAPIDWDWQSGASGLGLDPTVVGVSLTSAKLLTVTADDATRLWKDAPGPVPDAPADLLVHG